MIKLTQKFSAGMIAVLPEEYSLGIDNLIDCVAFCSDIIGIYKNDLEKL